LDNFKLLHKLATWDIVCQELLKFYPHTAPVQRRVKEKEQIQEVNVDAEDDCSNILDSKETKKNNLFRSLLVTRMVTECAVAVSKVPLVLALGCMYFNGTMHLDEIVSASQVQRMNDTVFQLDAGLLRAELLDLTSIHIQADISGRKGEERLSLWLTGFSRKTHANVKRNLWSGALASKSGFDQFDIVTERLIHLNSLEKLESLTADEGKDASGVGIGLYGRLLKHLGRFIILINCDLHKIDRGLVVACEAVFGKAEPNKPSVLQLIYLVPYCLSPWEKYRPLLEPHVREENKQDLTKPDLPITTRWHTVISASHFTHIHADALCSFGRQVFDYFPSTKQVARNLWKQIDVWLNIKIVRLQITILIDFGEFFYSLEMRWATASQFRCAELPLRWFTRMETLITALQSPAEYFICTYELAEKLSIDEDTRDRFEREIKIFLRQP
jgi:hypothetical protein